METHTHRPDVDPRWFWDFDFAKIDWQRNYKTIIARIIERGDNADWQEITRFYGEEKIVNALKNEIVFLPEYSIEDVCKYYRLKPEDLLCSTPRHLIRSGFNFKSGDHPM